VRGEGAEQSALSTLIMARLIPELSEGGGNGSSTRKSTSSTGSIGVGDLTAKLNHPDPNSSGE
jgi:hypothetical protein